MTDTKPPVPAPTFSEAEVRAQADHARKDGRLFSARMHDAYADLLAERAEQMSRGDSEDEITQVKRLQRDDAETLRLVREFATEQVALNGWGVGTAKQVLAILNRRAEDGR